MISIDSAQIDAWIVAFIFPLSRILGFIATAPLWSSNGVPRHSDCLISPNTQSLWCWKVSS